MGFLNNQFNRQQAPMPYTGQQGQMQDMESRLPQQRGPIRPGAVGNQ